MTDEQGHPDRKDQLGSVLFGLRPLDGMILVWAGLHIPIYPYYIAFAVQVSLYLIGTRSPVNGTMVLVLYGLAIVLVCVPRPQIKRIGYFIAAIALGFDLVILVLLAFYMGGPLTPYGVFCIILWVQLLALFLWTVARSLVPARNAGAEAWRQEPDLIARDQFGEMFPPLVNLRPVDRTIVIWALIHAVGYDFALSGAANGINEITYFVWGIGPTEGAAKVLYIFETALMFLSAVMVFFRRPGVKLAAYAIAALVFASAAVQILVGLSISVGFDGVSSHNLFWLSIYALLSVGVVCWIIANVLAIVARCGVRKQR